MFLQKYPRLPLRDTLLQFSRMPLHIVTIVTHTHVGAKLDPSFTRESQGKCCYLLDLVGPVDLPDEVASGGSIISRYYTAAATAVVCKHRHFIVVFGDWYN